MSYRFARKEDPSKRPLLFTILAVLVVGAGVTWAFYPREDQQLSAVKELGQKMRESENLPEDQRRALREQFRSEMDKLSEEERDQLWRERRESFQRQMEQRVEEVLSLPPEQQDAVLDRHIDEMEKRRKEWESRGERRGDNGPPGDRKQEGGAAKEGSKEANSGGGGQPRERTGANSRRNRMLDRSSPKQRAQMTEYRRLMNERRRERGLPPMGRGGR